MKRTIKDLVGLKGKRVLVRVDFNVPVDENGRISDTTRIDLSLPTINYLVKQQARVILVSHLGRPKGYEVHKSLWPVAMYLSQELPCPVGFCTGLLNEEAKYRIEHLQNGCVLLLENTRFFEGEESCDMAFSKELANLADIYVNDAFATAHRENASTFGVARILPNAIGLLMEKEIQNLDKIVKNPQSPFVAVIGGSKVSSKLDILNSLIEKADTLIIGGAMAYTFMKALGEETGESLVEDDMLDNADAILQKAEALGKKILLPIDHICTEGSNKKTAIRVKEMKSSMVGYDIGPDTVKYYAKEIARAKQVFWNGPMGKFEEERFAAGTQGVAVSIAQSKAVSVVGGGDTVAAVNNMGIGRYFTFVSTGGGATMEYIQQGSLPCIDVIQEKII